MRVGLLQVDDLEFQQRNRRKHELIKYIQNMLKDTYDIIIHSEGYSDDRTILLKSKQEYKTEEERQCI
ncbi:hypothetical protein AZF37_01415 [endosymbiont 'TC1' of Trimyema compressum]|uniref:hypothetical protein n=1 Tax=endosymbiont 'TC1' of Trimyema compressum TaxID=243899 RepID=UPI0007F115BB|nr:hypothetical protein [endosymbiont 'TC1' of Trimyema compressum]AMP20013.1 hypothetical protein AZF37_01415 [endosymbiont 'TC1' of Trimyema compressum]